MRIQALDVARGVAILGTLATNIWIITHPAGMVGYLANPITPDTAAGWALVQRAAMAVANGKFLALLTLMFGIGLSIQAESARRKGAPWPGSYPVRAGLLFVDGLVNYFLIAEFDVLMGYAFTGLIAAGLVLGAPRTRRLVAGVAAGVHLLLAGVLSVAVLGLPAMSTPTGPNVYRDGSWWDLVVFRADNMLAFRAEPLLLIPYFLAMYLIGAALLRRGIFTDEGAVLRKRLLVIGLGLAWPLDLAIGTFGGVAGFFASRYLLAPVVALGLLALVAHLCLRHGTSGRGARWLALVGRVSLSCYLVQNLVAGALCYGWGLGLAGWFGPHRVPWTLALYVALCAGLVIGARVWLAHSRRGPLEALWARSHEALLRGRLDG